MNDKLLTIELADETAVPRVFYKGKELTGKIDVRFRWETQTEEFGGMEYYVEHVDKAVKAVNVKTIGQKTGKYAFKDMREINKCEKN